MNLNRNNLFKIAPITISNLGQFIGLKNLSPPAILWFMTNNCNMTCRHCSLHQNKQIENKEKLMSIAQKLAQSDTPLISLTGGEPLLIPDIKEIISLLKSKAKIITLNTNGLILDKYAQFICDSKIDSIYISIDGHDAETHNSIRNKPDSFEIILENIKLLKSLRKNKKPYIGIRTVMMRNNIEHFEKIVDMFYDFADSFEFQPIYKQEKGPLPSDSKALFDKDNAMEERIVNEKLNLIFNKYPRFKNNFYKTIPDFLFHPEKIEKIAIDYCISKLFFSFIIFSDGEIYTCDKAIGNIHEQTIKQIWNGSERKDFFKHLSKQGYCSHPCWCSSYMSGSRLPGFLLRKVLQ